MSTGAKTVTGLVIAAFVLLLLWSTLSSQKVTCEVCVSFGGGNNCATASAASEADATRAAQSTACGILASGMAESVLCGDAAPTRRVCSTK